MEAIPNVMVKIDNGTPYAFNNEIFKAGTEPYIEYCSSMG